MGWVTTYHQGARAKQRWTSATLEDSAYQTSDDTQQESSRTETHIRKSLESPLVSCLEARLMSKLSLFVKEVLDKEQHCFALKNPPRV